MDALAASNNQLDFVRTFDFTAAPSFEGLLRKYTPRYETCDEEATDEFEKWQEARKGLEVLRQFGLALVQKAILDYLRFFVIYKIGDVPKHNGSNFLKYEKLLLNRTTVRWEDSPVSRDRSEQINLCRAAVVRVDAHESREHTQTGIAPKRDDIDSKSRDPGTENAKRAGMGKIVAAMATAHAPQLFTRPPEEDPAQLDAGIAPMRKLGKILDETNPDRCC